MHPLIITVLKEAIVVAREVITHTFFRKTPQETTQAIYIHEKVLDGATLEIFIDKTTKQLSSIINTQTQLLVDESRRQRVREAIQDVQARVNSLKMLVNSNSLDPNITMQLVITALNPLQVSLEIAKFRVQDYGDQDTWEACYIVGTSALLAGYSFLGQDVIRWQEELSTSMFGVQKRILNETAVKLLEAKQEIPWEKVPQLLSPEGVENLLLLYEGLTDVNKVTKQSKENNKSKSVELKVPKIGESIDEVTVGAWQVKDGDSVSIDDVLCGLDSDKATFELTAEVAGIIRHRAKEGDILPIGATIAIIEFVK